ncbi:MAG TPA: DUF58 domain-containing protein [Candidatus Polarisedimenticolaceae bacterium]|nr:DUF58 domain-containing protein [Candidatus Polarisedimenticolaceae bacterium]
MTPREVLRKVRRLEIRTRRLVDESLAGSYHSVFKGRGVEFAEVREYEPGDDVRTIDWNVSAKMGHPFVKKFTEERELTVVLVVDASASGRFGTGASSKLETAAEIGALLAFSAIRNNDRVGLLLFTDRIERFVPPRKGREHGLRVLRELLAFEPAGRGTAIAGALDVLRRVVTKRAVVFLISDFQDAGYEKSLRVTNIKHDLVAISVSDPREETLPPSGLLALRDAETGRPVLIDAGHTGVRRLFAERRAREVLRTREILKRSGTELLELSTGTDYDRALVSFFRERARRTARAGG